MGNYVNAKTLIAFVIGVMLSGYVMSLVGQAKNKIGG